VGTLVVGYGSELRGDDAAGRRVAEAIEQRALPGVTVATPTQLVPELAELIACAERVVFVDASITVDDVTVRRLTPQPTSPGSHHATADGLLGLVTALELRCPPAHLVEIPVADLSIGERLSATTAQAVDRAIAEVMALLSSPR
jgi:hydrogenase maturation protease